LVVGYGHNPSGFYHAIQWDANNPTTPGTDLGSLSGLPSASSFAYAVNSRNWVVGYSGKAFAMPQRPLNLLHITSPDDNLSGSDLAVATAINNFNQIAGGSANGATAEDAWIWQVDLNNNTRTTTKKDLGAISGWNQPRPCN
jgi:hypothetical protein